MKPNFALSLSFDGLRLMHRADTGWTLVGEVALDDPDLTGALAELRAAGLSLAPEGMRTKLLLPNEQIKYVALDTTRTAEPEVQAALDGATPYTLDDLSYDYSKGGGRTYIAAVARETLQEAEAFAAEHGFNPVSFVGVPDPFTYMGEPFFGTAAAAAGEDIERDSEPVVIVGMAQLPDPASVPFATETAPADLPEAQLADSAPDPAAIPSGMAATERPAALDDEDEDEPQPTVEEPVQAAMTAETGPALALGNGAGDPPAPGPTSAVDDDDADLTETEPALPVFGSRRNGNGADHDGMPRLSTAPGTGRAPPPPLVATTAVEETGPRLSAARRDVVPSADTPPVRPDTPAPVEDAPAITGEAETARDVTEAPVLGASLTARRDLDPAAPGREETGLGGLFSSRRRPAPATAAGPAEPEAEATTAFGARKRDETAGIGGKPRFLGLILTGILILFLLAVAALAAMNEETMSRWFGWGTEEEPVQIAAEPTAAPPEDVTTASADPDAGESSGDMTTASALPEEDAPEDVALADMPPVEDDILESGASPTELGQILTPDEAERLYDRTGVWQRAPRMAVQPRPGVASGIEGATSSDQAARMLPAALPDPRRAGRDVLIAAPINPPPPDAGFEFGPDGFIIASPEGTLTPDGILVFAGAPELLPPARPGTEAPAPVEVEAAIADAPAVEDDAAPDDVLLIAGRPALTPPLRPAPAAPEEAASDTIAPEGDEGLVVIAGRPTIEPPQRPVDETQPEPVAQPDAEEAAPEVSAPDAETDTETTDSETIVAPLLADGAAPDQAASPDATLPEDVVLIAGRPALIPPLRTPPAAPEEEASETAAPEGAEVEEGLVVIEGRPSQEPPARPVPDLAEAAVDADAAEEEEIAPGAVSLAALQGDLRPVLRPEGLADDIVPVQPAADATLRPSPRPAGLAPAAPEETPEPEVPEPEPAAAPGAPSLQLNEQIAAAVQAAASRPDPFATATASAVARSLRPDTRPRNMDRIVARARPAPQAQPAPSAQPAPAAAPVQPSAPTATTVARAATLDNAINLRDINLIGVYGTASDRRALVRMSNGRYERVTVGSRLDGGQVVAIGENSLIYAKRGRNITLVIGG